MKQGAYAPFLVFPDEEHCQSDDDEYCLLAEADGNSLRKRKICLDELLEEIAETLKSDERLDFYLGIDNDCLAVLAEDHDGYDCITEGDVKNYDTRIPVRKADRILLYRPYPIIQGLRSMTRMPMLNSLIV